VVIVSAVGVGAVTGWMDLRVATGNEIPLYGAQNCESVALNLSASVSPALGGTFETWLSYEGGQVSNQTGACVHLGVSTSTGDGFVPALSSLVVDFAATSGGAPHSDLTTLPSPVDVYPLAVSPVAVGYNLPGLSTGLRLNGSILASVYDGTITSWDAPEIASLNPASNLSAAPPITVLYQSPPSVSNSVFTGFLADSSPVWNSSVGAGPSVAWPTGIAVNSSGDLLHQLEDTPGAIGYSELFNGTAGPSQTAQVENSYGAFISPDGPGAEAAVTAVESSPAVVAHDWTNVSAVNAPGPLSYPMVQISYLALYHDLGVAYGAAMSAATAGWLMTFLWWISQSTAFAPLPTPFLAASEQALTNVTYDGTPILQVQDPEGGETGGETGEF
jgi:phosphate transport system substrate-binding protein